MSPSAQALSVGIPVDVAVQAAPNSRNRETRSIHTSSTMNVANWPYTPLLPTRAR